MKKTGVPRQSDIVIHPDGEVSISFLWKDLTEVTLRDREERGLWNPSSVSDFSDFQEYSQCRMCPKACGWNRQKSAHPRCGDTDFRVSTWGASMGDESMISGSRGSGTIMLAGCPLSCPSCHNPEMVAYGKSTSFKEMIAICENLFEEGVHNLQFLSPTVHLPKLRELLAFLKKELFPLPIVLKSSGYESLPEVKKLEGLVDVYLPDFKYGPCSKWAMQAGAPHYYEVAEKVIAEMVRQVGSPQVFSDGLLKKGVLVRHVEAPLPPAEKAKLDQLLKELEQSCLVSRNDRFVELEKAP